MIYVTSVDGSKVEPLHLFGEFKVEQSTDGKFTLSLNTYPGHNNPGYDVLKSECIVTVDGFDFKVKQFNHSEYSKSITATNTFFELSKVRKNDIYGGTTTLEERVNFCLTGTGWTASFENDDVRLESAIMMNFGENNVISLVDEVCAAYKVEFIVRENNVVHFAKEVGSSDEHIYRYKYNISDVKLVEDTTDLYTKITGTGKDGLSVTYTSPSAAIFGEMEADPVENSEIDDETNLVNWLKTQLNDVPKVVIESTVPELTVRKTGEKVWLIYEPLNVELETRILSQTKVLDISGKLVTSSVTLGNIVPKTYTDLLVEQIAKIDRNDKKNRSKFLQTNQLILMEVERVDESIAQVTIRADEIASSVTDLDSNMRSRIVQTADAIRAELTQQSDTITEIIDNRETAIISAYTAAIQASATSLNSSFAATITAISDDISAVETTVSGIQQTANAINATVTSQQTTINSQGGRLATAESNISVVAGSITNMVTRNEYTGETIVSKITQTPDHIKIAAKDISFDGAVMVNGHLRGNGSVEVSTNATIGRKLYLTASSTTTGDCGIQFGNSSSSWMNSHIKASEASGWSDLSIDSGGDLYLSSETELTIHSVFGDIVMVGGILDLSAIDSIRWGTNRPSATWG